MKISGPLNTLLLGAATAFAADAPAEKKGDLTAQNIPPTMAAIQLAKFDQGASAGHDWLTNLVTTISTATTMQDFTDRWELEHNLRHVVYPHASNVETLKTALQGAEPPVQQGFQSIFQRDEAYFQSELQSTNPPVRLIAVPQTGSIELLLENKGDLTIAFQGTSVSTNLTAGFSNTNTTSYVVLPGLTGNLGFVDADKPREFLTTGYKVLELDNLKTLCQEQPSLGQ